MVFLTLVDQKKKKKWDSLVPCIQFLDKLSFACFKSNSLSKKWMQDTNEYKVRSINGTSFFFWKCLEILASVWQIYLFLKTGSFSAVASSPYTLFWFGKRYQTHRPSYMNCITVHIKIKKIERKLKTWSEVKKRSPAATPCAAVIAFREVAWWPW